MGNANTRLKKQKACHGLTWQPAAKHQTAARSPLPFLPRGMGKRNGQKGNPVGWDKTVQ